MKNNKEKIISTVVFSAIFITVFAGSNLFNNMKLDVNASSVSYVYKDGKLVNSVTDKESINYLNQEVSSVKEANPNQELNTQIVDSKTLFTEEPTSKQEVDKVVAEVDTKMQGYIITIDGKKMEVTDINYYNEAIDQIYRSILPTEDMYNIYKATGNIPTFSVDGRVFTDIKIESKVKIEQGYIEGEKTLNSTDEVVYYLLHGNDPKQVETISENQSFKDIQQQSGMSDALLRLNNNGMSNTTLFYDGQEVIVNPLNPQIKIASYYEEQKVEEIPYHTQYQENSDMGTGEENELVAGRSGSKVVTYKTKTINNQFDSTTAVKTDVTERSVDRVVEVGTTDKAAKTAASPSTSTTASGVPTGSFMWPSNGGVICGWMCYAGHQAVDIQAWYGAPIYAADGGTVSYVGWWGGGGNTVMIDHGNGFTTEYMHMSSTNVTVGQKVSKGDVIGYEGTTGYVTTNHVHFEIRYNGVPYNPMDFY